MASRSLHFCCLNFQHPNYKWNDRIATVQAVFCAFTTSVRSTCLGWPALKPENPRSAHWSITPGEQYSEWSQVAWSVGIRSSLDLGVLGINLGAEHDPHERVSNERVRFPSMLLKLTTTAIVLNKGIVFNEEHFIRHCLQLVGTMIIICRAAFGQFYYCFETYLQALRVLTACTWAPLPPLEPQHPVSINAALVRASLGFTGPSTLCLSI